MIKHNKTKYQRNVLAGQKRKMKNKTHKERIFKKATHTQCAHSNNIGPQSQMHNVSLDSTSRK